MINVLGIDFDEEVWWMVKMIVDSLFVKMVIIGFDLNWGRIILVVGYFGIFFELSDVSFLINGM